MVEFRLRSATPEDIPILLELIKALAEYEHLSNTVTGNAEQLKKHLFGPRAYAEVLLAEGKGQIIGFALFWHNYSTFLTKPGIHLEDLFVTSEFRRKGIGKAFLTYLAHLAVERDCGRLEWHVLDWNESAISFYERMGASVLPDWRICRVSGDSLGKLARLKSF
ncbi:MAG: GNAT family N-acetyltransferase [Coleofasciculaceae cyanobacterium]